MRHRKSGRKLNRESSHRLAMFKNMSISLLEHEMIRTTLPKAKELRRYVEPLITLAKVDSVANRRLAFSRLGNSIAVKRLFELMGPRYKTRPGGYLRLLKCGFRKGDAAPMAYVQLVDSVIATEGDSVIEADVVEKAQEVATKAIESTPKPKSEPAAKPKVTKSTAASESSDTATKKPAKAKASAKPKAVQTKPAAKNAPEKVKAPPKEEPTKPKVTKPKA